MTGLALLAANAPKADNLSIFDPASPPSESIRTLSVLVFAISGLIFVIVEGVLLYNLYRFRHARKEPASEPPQVYGGQPIEIAWTVAPTLIVCILVLVTARTLWEVNLEPPQPKPDDHTLFVTVVGRQWWWELRYNKYDGRDLGFITANELHVPASSANDSRRVYLELQSADVAHSFWVPRLGGKTDLIPGKINQTWFETRELGLFYGQCAEYCGTQHAGMLLRVVVDSRDDFQKWLDHQRQPAVDNPALRSDRGAFLAESCVNCHRVRGTVASGSYAPDLTHLMSRETLAAGTVSNTVENLDRWVNNPQELKLGCLMPAFGLDRSRRTAIVRYLASLR
jgi:cytochrome c oxidase subunit II